MLDSFGLGLILSFTDNATSGMLNASSALRGLSNSADTASRSASSLNSIMAGMNLNIIGSLMANTGQSIMSVFSNLIGNVQKTGSEFESFRITLNQIYGDAEAANQQLDKLMNFSATTPFEVNDVKDLLVTLKSQGIEAFDEMTSKSGKLKQANLAWLGDLMTFKPEVPAQRWKTAIQNYVGSGEFKVLRNILDMGSIEQILGHGVGDTIEKRWNDIIEIVDKKNLGGLMAANMGTFTQVLSNVEDQFTRLYLKIADAGPFDSLKVSLNNLVATFADLDESKVQAFANSISSGLTLVLKPLEGLTKMLGDLTSKIIKFSSTHPYFMRVITVLGAITGVGLVAFGTLLKFSGSLYMLTIALQGLPNIAGLVTQSLGLLTRGLFSLTMSVLPFALMAALAYEAWTSNLFGIQDVTRNVSNVVGLHIKALIASWDGVLTLEEYDWIEKAGLLPFINAIQDLKYSFGILADGVKRGFLSVFNKIDTVFQKITGAGRSLKDIIDNLAKKVLDISGYKNYEEVWEGVGKKIGAVSAILFVVIPLVKLLGIAFSIATSPITLLIGSITLLTKGFIYLKNNIRDSKGHLTSLGETVKNVLGGIGRFIDKIFAKDGNNPFETFLANLIGPNVLNDFSNQLDYLKVTIKSEVQNLVQSIDFKKVGTILIAGLFFLFNPSFMLGISKNILLMFGIFGTSLFKGIMGFSKEFLKAIPGLLPILVGAFDLIKESFLLIFPNFVDIFSRGFGTAFSFLSSKLVFLKTIIVQGITKLGPVASILSKPFVALGGFLIPFLTALGGKLTAFVAHIGGAFSKIGLLGGIIASKLGPVVTLVGGYFLKIGSFIKGSLGTIFLAVAGPLKNAFAALAGPLVSGLTSMLGPAMSLLGALGTPMLLGGAIIGGIGVLCKVINDHGGDIKKTFQSIWDSLPDGIKEPLVKVGKYLASLVNKVGKALGFKEPLKGLQQWAGKVWSTFVSIGEHIISAIQPVIDYLTQAWDGWLGNLCRNVISFFDKIVDFIGVAINTICEIFKFLWEYLEPVITMIGEIINSIVEVLNGVIDFLIGVFTGNWELAWEGIKEIFSGIWNAIKAVATGVLNAIIGAVNLFIEYVVNGILSLVNGIANAVSGVLSFIGLDIGTVNLKVNEIPYLNTGGFIKNEGISYLHPNEVVINDPTTRSLQNFLKKENNNERPHIDLGPLTDVLTNLSKKNKTKSFTDNDNNNNKKDNWFIYPNFSMPPIIIPPVKVLPHITENKPNNIKPLLNAIGGEDNKKEIINKPVTPLKKVKEPSIEKEKLKDRNFVPITQVTTKNSKEVHEKNVSSDNRVIFSEGSIIIQCNNVSSTSELESMADKLIKIIERKKRIKNLAVRP